MSRAVQLAVAGEWTLDDPATETAQTPPPERYAGTASGMQ
jgi:hypothetical protein